MAYTSCAAKIAASIQQNCERPLVGGYTGRAVIIPANDFARADVVVLATNPREILSIILPPDGSVMPYSIDNVFQTPFSGSSTAGNADNGRNGYLKTLAVRVPMRGADVSKDVVEPLVKDAAGFVVIVEKRDKVGDGSFEVIGYQNSVRGDISSVTRDESANGGDWLVNLTAIESWAEVTLVGSAETYYSAKKEFEGLLYFEPNEIRMTSSIGGFGMTLSADGLVYIDTYKNGIKTRNIYTGLNDNIVNIIADANSEVVIYGDVTSFSCTNNSLSSLDVRKNVKLQHLYCHHNSLTSLDLSKNVDLVKLGVSNNPLASLDVSKNINLQELSCTNNSLSSLDVSKNIKLQYLYCHHNSLTSLDLSKNLSLVELSCQNNSITSLDLSNNTALVFLNCYDIPTLMLIDIQNTNALADGTILDQGMANLTTLQVAGTSAWAYEKVESWLSDFAPDGGMIYVDENTPQGVITEAEGKSWEVVYVS